MATYDNDLRLKEITTGDESGTWGTSTNTNLELIAEAFSYGTEASFSSDADATTTIADGLTDPARSLYFKVTSGVSLTATRTLTIAPNDVSKIWIIENATSGSQSINISQGSGANITIPAGDTKVVYSDGAGAGAAFFDAFASLSVVDLKVQDDLTVTGDIDVDGTTNLDVVDIDGAVDMASTLGVTGVATLASLVATTADINGGTIDGTVIGGTTPAAGTFTTLTANTSITGTLATAAQTNITSVGTLTGLTVNGNVSVDGGTIKLDGNYPTGTGNVALGNSALDDGSLSGGGNTAIGSVALTANTTGSSNTAVGNRSLTANTTGVNNSAFGQDSLTSNSEGNSNVAVGINAMLSNTTGSQNVGIGQQTLNASTTGSYNTAVGFQSLFANTTASENTAMGISALGANTTGGGNTAVGRVALAANTTAANNTAVGTVSLYSNTTGASNAALGAYALQNNTTGANNAAVGYGSLLATTTGNFSTALGHSALTAQNGAGENTAVGHASQLATTSGTGNTSIGEGSGRDITTGSQNVMIGADTGRAASPSGSITTQSNRLCMGNNNITNAYIKVAWTVTSDKRDKTDIEPLTMGLNFVNKLEPVTYKWDMRSDYKDGKPDGTHKKENLQGGLLAQDVEELERAYGYKVEDGTSILTDKNPDGNYGLTYSKFIPVLINAVQELSTQVDELKSELLALKGE
jgi:trimeric autotransporter adhesin